MNKTISRRHYSKFMRYFLLSINIIFLIGCFFHIAFIGVLFLLGISIGVVNYCTFVDKTSVEIDDKYIYGTEVVWSSKQKIRIPISKILLIKYQKHKFVMSGEEAISRTRTVKKQWKAYSKHVIMIKTSKRVYRIGEKLVDDKLYDVFKFIKKNVEFS